MTSRTTDKDTRSLFQEPSVGYPGPGAYSFDRDFVGRIAVFLLSLFLLMGTVYFVAPSYAHPMGRVLDLASVLPSKSQGSVKTTHQPSAAEAVISSVKALSDVMRQAMDVAATLPADDKTSKTRPTVSPRNLPSSPMEHALKIVSRLPNENLGDVIAGPSGRPSFYWPVEGLIYSTFNACRGRNRRHGAIDIVAPRGTPIASAADGRVSVAANGGCMFSGYGKIVIVDHENGFHTVYAHCDRILVKMGQRVKRGEFIATVGRTGRATTNHLHFEVRVAGKKRDPLKYLPGRPEMVRAHNWRSGTKKANR